MAADTTPEPAQRAQFEHRRATYDFCEKAFERYESTPLSDRLKGFSIGRAQTISGDTVQRTYIVQFDLKLTGCELPTD
jgi:hypothetical protein